MPDYHFRELSPHDFEILVRDVLQRAWGITLESFASGRDRGIDIRYSTAGGDVVVQCKHYPHDNWNSLHRTLREEVAKVRILQPQRYVLVTSMALTPDRKAEIQSLFTPYCKAPSDVLGRDDINNLLGLHPEVERSHHKLWLSSVPILTRVLNSGIFAEQEAEHASITRRISRFVENPSIRRASDILSRHHFVMVTGVPGIGKTTLAEMLMISHIADGYECFRVWESVEEARRVLQRGKRQLFYFDDFLGRTGLKDQIHRNEDERLVRFIRELQHLPNTKLILTTREYILNQAKAFMEALATEDIEIGRCILELRDYTQHIRAQILYNHLYFSTLPSEHLEAFVESRIYRTIVRHPNYNPRILEAMTDALNVRTMPSHEYPKQFIEALNKPHRIWKVAFDRHLSREAQHLLLVLVTLPDVTRLLDLEHAFEHFHAGRSGKYGHPRSPYDWQRAAKELEGNFIRTELNDSAVLVQFHNPSIRDFLESHLVECSVDADDLSEFARYAAQQVTIWHILKRKGQHLLVPERIVELATRYWRSRGSGTPEVRRVMYAGLGLRWENLYQSILQQYMTLLQIVTGHGPRTESVLHEPTTDLLVYLRSGDPNRTELVRLLDRLLKPVSAREPHWQELIATAVEQLLNVDRYYQVDDFQSAIDFLDSHPDVAPLDARGRLTNAFNAFIDEEVRALMDESDADTRLSWFDSLEKVAGALDLDLPITRQEVEEDIPELESDDEDSGWSASAASPERMSDDALDALFDSLRHHGER
jgi:hypothetical protein